MTHITLTGPAAGYPVCGCDKPTARANGDEFSHIPYSVSTVERLKVWAEAANLCPNCAAEVIAAWSE